MHRFASWVRANRLEFLIVILVVTIALFFRLWQIDQYMTFLGDEGRDALVVKQLIYQIQYQLTGFAPGDHKWTLLGPTTSVGNMYLGPLYYYLMIIPLWLANFSPVGPAVAVALLGTATVFLIWLAGREMFSPVAGIIAALLYAFSPVTIYYAKSSWNPNPMPLFALMTVFAMYRVLSKKQFGWLVVAGTSLAFALQMHYLGTILAAIVSFFWLLALRQTLRSPLSTLRSFLICSLISLLLFSFLMSPLVWFDLRHGGINYQSFVAFFSQRETTVNINPLNALGRIPDLYSRLFVTRYLAGFDQLAGTVVSILLFIYMIYKAGKLYMTKKTHWGFLVVGVWFALAIFGMSLYKMGVFDHYFGFVNPALFLLTGVAFAYLFQKNVASQGLALRVLAMAMLAYLLFLSAAKNPNLNPPNRQLSRTQQIVFSIIEEVQNSRFNFALISRNNYDAAYQYYLELAGHQPVAIDAQDTKNSITDQLIVVCEDPICQPVGHPKFEIAGFGWSKIDKEWQVMGTKLFKLGHYIPTN
ncbi:glycosyltransferase family 39 protein [Candidatus Daviesbacteria bacterium]|nr:glycosyltransferase family 39 protein [Candidatus Daviesbacteria bacterium]